MLSKSARDRDAERARCRAPCRPARWPRFPAPGRRRRSAGWSGPSQIRLSLAMASPVRSIWAASARADRHPEIPHILRRLAQGRGVDAQEGQCSLRSPKRSDGHGRAFGLGHEARSGRPGWRRCAGRAAAPAVRRPSGSAAAARRRRSRSRRPPPTAGWSASSWPVRSRPSTRPPVRPAHVSTCSAVDGGARATAAMLRPARRSSRGRSGPSPRPRPRQRRSPRPARSRPGGRRLRAGCWPASISRRQAAEAARPGLADAFQLGAHLAAADGREADADPLLSHRGVLRSVRSSLRTITASITGSSSATISGGDAEGVGQASAARHVPAEHRAGDARGAGRRGGRRDPRPASPPASADGSALPGSPGRPARRLAQ